MRKALFPLLVATFALSAIASAETITGVTFQGPAGNPTITITGTGFLPEPTPSGFLSGGAVGDDFGPSASTFSISSNGAFSFTAGQDGDIIGLANINYTDTQITYQLGSNYASNYHVQYALDQGDPYTLFVNNVEASGTVDYGVSVVPEPSSLMLFGTGVLSVFGMARRRFSRS